MMMIAGFVLATSIASQHVPQFFAQLALLILLGRLLGEWMQRKGQPAVMGQLLAGIILGPSVFGAIWPAAQKAIFPPDRQMLNAVSELGILLLLLLTGMETNLSLVKRERNTSAIISAAGVIVPFGIGYLLGQMLPDSMLPDPSRHTITSLFVATALSISSVKIVAAVLRELDFFRRTLGQIILAAAILDDTIGWTILAIIGGLVTRGEIATASLLVTVAATLAFLVFAFTIGRRWIALAIRWVHDHFVSEMPVISMIIVVMLLLALVTDFIGVHTVLGAFVAGIMIGQSPILTRHIEEQLRGLIVALFMPVFFGMAGLSIDLKVLFDPSLLAFALLFIGVASLGKLGGCYLGSRIACLNHEEALTVGLAMNARGSTEVILATIGLALGVLNLRLFTVIVLMAVVTTLCMPPLLRWSLARVPIRKSEKARLEAEAASEKDIIPELERILVVLDSTENGQLAARLAGWMIGARNLSATIINVTSESQNQLAQPAPSSLLIEAARNAAAAIERAEAQESTQNGGVCNHVSTTAPAERIPMEDLISILPFEEESMTADEGVAGPILAESRKDYGLLFLGLGFDSSQSTLAMSSIAEELLSKSSIPVAVVLHQPSLPINPDMPIERILVPTTGADYSRFGAELAIGIAKGCSATVTAIHVAAPPAESDLMRHPDPIHRSAHALLDDTIALGKREGVTVKAKSLVGQAHASAILRQIIADKHNLVVLGTKMRSEAPLHLGTIAASLVERAPCPIVVVNS